MKSYFQAFKLLFYLLSTFLFFLLGMILAGVSGAADGQGLAGGAIVLFYGLIAAGIALIFSIVAGSYFPKNIILKLNYAFASLIVVIILVLRYRR